MNQVYGYIRVSSQNQKEDRQRIALESLQIPKKNIFLDKQSGKNFERPQYQQMVKQLKKTICFMLKALTV